jgi:hypothetical protein
MSSRWPSPGTAISLIALFVALSGTSYAVTRPSPRTVGVAQLKTGAVTRAKIRGNAVNSAKVASGSLLASDFAAGQIPPGPTGPPGVAALTNADGAAGFMCSNGGGACQVGSSTAQCPPGSFVTGGGYASTGSIDLVVPFSRPNTSTAFAVIAINYDSTAASITARATCASGQGLTARAASRSAQGADLSAAVNAARAKVAKR